MGAAPHVLLGMPAIGGGYPVRGRTAAGRRPSGPEPELVGGSSVFRPRPGNCIGSLEGRGAACSPDLLLDASWGSCNPLCPPPGSVLSVRSPTRDVPLPSTGKLSVSGVPGQGEAAGMDPRELQEPGACPQKPIPPSSADGGKVGDKMLMMVKSDQDELYPVCPEASLAVREVEAAVT